MKRISFIIIVLIFSGCSTTWHVNKVRDKCPECFDLDTTITELVFKRDTVIKLDTNILVFLPEDTVFIDTTIKKLKPYSFKPIYAKNGIINIEASMKRGVLKLKSYLDSTMIYHLEAEILVRDALITEQRTIMTNQTITIEKQENELKWYQKWLRIGKFVLIGLAVLLIVGIGYKIYKVFYK